MRPYRDRTQAGEVLAARLGRYARRQDVVVLALPRGGVPVAAPISRSLRAPLDVLAVRKLGVPGREELALGALAHGPAGEVLVRNEDVVADLGLDEATVAEVTAEGRRRLADHLRRWRAGRPAVDCRGRVVVLVDDGLATGATMEAAVVAARQAEVAGVVAVAPVGAPEAVARLAARTDLVVCPQTPRHLRAVGFAYDDFSPVDDETVLAVLRAAAPPPEAPGSPNVSWRG